MSILTTRRRDELWSTNNKVIARSARIQCKLTHVHMPRGSTIENNTVFGVICQLPLLREEFRIPKLTFHSDLRRRTASRRALPRTSSLSFCVHAAFCHRVIKRLWMNKWRLNSKRSHFKDAAKMPCPMLRLTYRVAQKNCKLSYFVHIFAKYWPIFTIFLPVDSVRSLSPWLSWLTPQCTLPVLAARQH